MTRMNARSMILLQCWIEWLRRGVTDEEEAKKLLSRQPNECVY